MIRSTRNVYIVENIKSGRIEQAIFILKPGLDLCNNSSTEIAIEAEKIINTYISKLENEKKLIKGDKNKRSLFISGIVITTLILTSILIINTLR